MDELAAPKREHYDFLHAAETQSATAACSVLLANAIKRVPTDENNKRLVPEAVRTYAQRHKQMKKMNVPVFHGTLAALPANIRAGTVSYDMAQAVIDLAPSFVQKAEAEREKLDAEYFSKKRDYDVLVADAKAVEAVKAVAK